MQDAFEIDFEMTVGRHRRASPWKVSAAGQYRVGTVSTVVDHTFVDNLPLNGRSFQTLIMLAPGVVVTPTAFDDQGQFSVNGQRADANYFTVDGVSAELRGNRLLPTGANRRWSAACAQRFGRHKQPCLGGCHAGISRSNIVVRSGVRTHPGRADFYCDPLRNQQRFTARCSNT